MKLLTLDIQGEEVLVIYHDKDALNRSRHVIESKMGNLMEFEDRSYASFHDPIPYFTNRILNNHIQEDMRNG